MSEETPSGWYQTGDEPEPKGSEFTDASWRKRFWLRADDSCIICFIDDDPFRIFEHNARIGGEWGNVFTCTSGLGEGYEPCPGCPPPRSIKKRVNRYRAGFVTIVSEAEFKGQDGTIIKNIRRLYPMKKKLLTKFTVYKTEDRGGSMVGTRWKVRRTSDTSHAVGDDWTFIDRIEGIDPEKLTEGSPEAIEQAHAEARRIISRYYDMKDIEGVPIPEASPFDYINLLKPQKAAELNATLGLHLRQEEPAEAGPGAPVNPKVRY